MTGVWNRALLEGVKAASPGKSTNKLRDESGFTVRYHEDFFEWYTGDAEPKFKKKAQYCLRELLVRGDCSRKKVVQGAAKGWIRSTLGGGSGSHYYLWWAPYGFPPVEGSDLQEDEILVRAVRHHDDTDKPLGAGDASLWHLLGAEFVHDPGDSELTEAQALVAAPDGPPVRIVRGHPGSGKTTALHHAGSHVWGERALYLTFSSRLAQDTLRHFQRFAPLETTVDALTFSELLDEMQGLPPTPPRPGHRPPGARELAEHLHLVMPQLGPWAERPEELFAELHAHALGRALPVPFRKLPAATGPTVDEEALFADRAEQIGEKAAESMVFAARQLVEKGALDDVFPVLRTARRLLDDSAADLPSRFSNVSAVFVDEVQDLTVVEAMLLLTVVARIGSGSGVLPHLVLTGDEAQTVRPTAFRWGRLRDLITLVLGESHSVPAEADIALSENMRSSRAISLVIEATRSHYKLLDKEDRPGGLKYGDEENESEGKVLYCHVPTTDGWAEVGELFAGHASAQLVHPGPSVPSAYREGIDADIAASEQVKGLDFDLVGVVGAGAKQVELEDLAAKAGEDQLAGTLGRNIADQFRVAVSRSRQDLVLLDHGPDDHLPAIRSLMKAATSDPVMDVDVSGLRDELADDSNPLDRLDGQLDHVEEILDTDPERALTKARAALSLRDSVNDVPAPMAARASRLFGIAAALVSDIRSGDGDVADAQRLGAEARKAFAEVELGQVFDDLRSMTMAAAGDLATIDPSIVTAALAAHPVVLKQLSPLEPRLRAGLHQWIEAVSTQGLLRGDSVAGSFVATELVVETFPNRPEFAERRRESLIKTAELARQDDAFEDELLAFEELDDGHESEMARCLEALDRHDEALTLYEQLGDHAGAYRCAREVPDLDRATALAPEVDPEAVGRLRWAAALRDLVDPAYTDEGGALTDAERVHLSDLITSGVARAVDSVVVDGAAVDAQPSTLEPSPDPDADSEPGAAELTPVSEEPTPAQTEPAIASDEAMPDTPLQPVAPADVNGIVALTSVASELGVSEEAAAEVSRKLGIRLVGDERTMNDAQAGRLRRRIETHGVG